MAATEETTNQELEVRARHAQDIARREGPADDRLDSEKVVVAAPFSYAGSAERIWPYFKRRFDAAKRATRQKTPPSRAAGAR
jgi:hypothetical protein